MSSSESDDFEVIDHLKASLSPDEIAKIQAWLNPTDYATPSSEFHRHLSSLAPGTGLWICDTSQYAQWQSSNDHGSLWIKGVPGAGKSVIAASMIRHLADEKTPVLYFFFRYIIAANRGPRGLVRDFLAQLLPYSVRLQAALLPLVGNPLEDFSRERLWEFLLMGLSSVMKAYCVVDALDEMELLPRDGFLEQLNSLATFRPSAVKVLMTSRPKQYLQRSLKDASIVHVSLEDDLVGKDIEVFLSYRLKSFLPLVHQEGLRKTWMAAIAERSGGLFLYARLLLDQITPSQGSSAPDVESLVRNLPVGLEQMYNSMLCQQAALFGIDVRVQVLLLELATHSSRALRLNEMAGVLASVFPASMLPDAPKAIARSACAPLIEILEDETVSVIHHSFTEFLLNKERGTLVVNDDNPQFPVLDRECVHKKLSVICMDYLRSGVLRANQSDRDFIPGIPGKDGDGFKYQEAKLRHPVLDYAVGNWTFHASKYDIDDEDFFNSVASFLDPTSLDFRKWLELEWSLGPMWSEGMSVYEIQTPTPLHVAAFAGLTCYAKKLMEQSVEIDPRDAEERTPLHWACSRGHTGMVSLLLACGAIPDPEDSRGVKPIHLAARRNYATIVKMLLEAGVDPLTPKTKEDVTRRLRCGEVGTKGETAVEYVWLQGHTDTIVTMLPFLTPETLEELFCQCCRYGKFEAVRAILNATSISPNVKSSGATALYLACLAKSIAIVELLLEKGADVHQISKWRIKNRNSCGGKYHDEPLRFPIHGVVIGWRSVNNMASQQLLRLLLNAGADINTKDADGDTLLLSLFGDYNIPDADFVVVSGLLHAGADVLAVDDDGDSVLHRCLRGSQDIRTLKLLFKYGARGNILSLSKDGDTVLHAALKNSHGKVKGQSMADVVNLLLANGARCDVKNKNGTTAIEEAAQNWNCSLETFTVMLDACSDPEALKQCMWKLTREGKDTLVGFIKILQDRGVSLEDRDGEGRTVLLRSITASRYRVLFLAFLECGADFHAVDAKGRGVLHYYIASPPYVHGFHDCIASLEEVVALGLDPLQVDYEGNSLLHEQARIFAGHEKDENDVLIIQRLLDYGISANAKNKQGMTPLHVHLENWNVNTVTSAVSKRLEVRFQERSQMLLLELLQRNKEPIEINAQDADGVTLFHLAAMRSETRLFYLLGKGADATILTKKGRNALHLACRARQSGVVGYLCQHFKWMVNQPDEFGRTPLHDACTSGRPESVRLLLKAGADPNVIDNNKRTPLHACAEFADEQRIWTLLSRRNETSGQVFQDRFRPASTPPSGYVPWYAVAQPWLNPSNRRQEIPNIGLVVKVLVSADIDIMAVDSDVQTALDLAIEYDCPETIRALQFGASLLRKKWELKPEDHRLDNLLALKQSPFSLLSSDNALNEEILRDLSTYLHCLAIDELDLISKHGGNITGADEGKPAVSGKSFQHIAASLGLTHLVEECGPLARVNDDSKIVLERIHNELAVNPKYRPEIENVVPALHIACARELPNMDVIEVLVEKCGVNVNAHALAEPYRGSRIENWSEGGTALHVLANAIYFWQLEALEYLIRNGADIEALNEKGETPLHIACTNTTFAAMKCEHNVYGYWRIESVKMLLGAGANVHSLDREGLSCLHKASSSPQIMRILLEHGADVTVGKLSPIFPAIQIQCLETVTILLDAGVSPNVVDPSKVNEGFQVHYTVRDVVKSALLCASFSHLFNQQAKDNAPTVKLLIERGADVYAVINDKTLVHYVFQHAEYPITSAFFECADKINFNTRDAAGNTVFLAACDWDECPPGFSHKHWYPKETAAFIRTLEYGGDALAHDPSGRNALHHLLQNPEMEDDAIIQFLALDVAKNLLYQKDNDGFAAMNYALKFLRPAVVNVLCSMGVSLLTHDPTGATALHRIAEQCIQSCTPLRRHKFGCEHTPEYYAGARSLWTRFLALGGDINTRDNDGNAPLFSYLSSPQSNDYKLPPDHCCHLDKFSTYFSEEVVGTGLDFHAKNAKGENALHVIAKRVKGKLASRRKEEHDHEPVHDKELFRFFVGKGLDPLAEDGEGRSSLDVAAACEQKGILELFQYGK